MALALLLTLATTAGAENLPGTPATSAAHPLDVLVLLVDDMDDFSCARTAEYRRAARGGFATRAAASRTSP